MRTVAALILLAWAVPATAQPWQAGAGHVSVGAAFSTLRTMHLATPSGEDVEIPRFARQDLVVSGSYGATDRLTIIVGGTLFAHTSIEGFDSAGGVGDARFGAQFLLGQRGPWTMGVRAIVQAPTGDGEKAFGLLPTGTGAWEGDAVFSIGRPIGARTFSFVEAGYHARGLGLRDTFVFNSQVGVIAGPRVTLGWNVRGVQPFDNGPIGLSVGSGAGLGDGVAFVAYGPSAAWRLNGGWTVLAGVDGGFHTRNLAAGAAYRVGVSYAK